MVRKRASLKGMGADIFYGEGVPPEPRVKDEADLDLEEALAEEAGAAQPMIEEEVIDDDVEAFLAEEVLAAEPEPPSTVVAPEEPERPSEAVPPPSPYPEHKPRPSEAAPPPYPWYEPRPSEAAPPSPYPEHKPRPSEAAPPPPYPWYEPRPSEAAPPSPYPEHKPRPSEAAPPPPYPWYEPRPSEAEVSSPPEADEPFVDSSFPPPEDITLRPEAPPAIPEPGPLPPYEAEYVLPPRLSITEWPGEEALLLWPKEPLGQPPIPGAEDLEEEAPLLEFEEREEQPSRRREEEEVLEFYGRRREKLNKSIDILFDTVPRELVGREMGGALKLLTEARDILAEKPRQFDEAEYKVARAEAIVENRRIIRYSSSIHGNILLFYEIIWFLLLFAGFLLSQRVIQFVSLVATPGADATLFFTPFWNTMMWGGIGGVVGALYSLYWHVAVQQDFNKYYTMSYVVQPIMGLILGGAIYLVMAAGFLGTEVQKAAGVAIYLPSLVAFVAGFRQQFVYELIDMIVKRLTPSLGGEGREEAEIEEVTEESTGESGE